MRLVVIYTPPRRRGIRLTHLVERWVGGPNRPLVARHVSGYRVTCDLRDTVQRSLFYCGTYEPKTTSLIAEALEKGDTFLDVGANAGHFTFVAARLVGKSGRVLAVEASKETAEALVRDIAQNDLGGRVTVHNVAAGDHRSTAALYAAGDSHQIGMRHLNPAGGEFLVEQSRVIRLDLLLSELGIHPDVVKLDIEGSELRALVGMSATLSTNPPRLVVAEAQEELLRRFGDSPEGMIKFMASHGYRAEVIGEKWHSDSFAFRLLHAD